MNTKTRRGVLLKTILAAFFLMGCARVSIDSKEPIKLDVTMRLDIYQHVASEAKAIEDMIAAPKAKPQESTGKMSFLGFGQSVAWAEDAQDFPADVKAAIERRRDRKNMLDEWESKGVIGENRLGFVEVKNSSLAQTSVLALINEENNDRKLIYKYIAEKNGASFEETGKIFAQRIQAAASAGTLIETDSGWMTK